MILAIDIKNKEVIEISFTKASQFLSQRKEILNLVEVASVHSSQKINSDFTGIGFNKTITANEYIKKYNLK